MQVPRINYLEKFLTAILVTLLTCTIFSYLGHTPKAEQVPGVGYFSFGSLMLIYLLYVTPAFFLGAVPFSVFAEILMTKVKRKGLPRYFMLLAIYAVGGFVVGFIYVWSIEKFRMPTSDTLRFLWVSFVASLLFLHVSLLNKFIFFRKLTTEIDQENSKL